MKVILESSRSTKLAPDENFTGTVLQDEIVTGAPPSRLRGLSVSFSPGARTGWHTHAVGQTLYVLYGSGRVQTEGAKPIPINPWGHRIDPAERQTLAWRSAGSAIHPPGVPGGH